MVLLGLFFLCAIPAHALVSTTVTDADIETSFRQSYVYKTYFQSEAISMVATRGVVIISGEVTNRVYKPLAQDTCEALPGVSRVENHCGF